jgi:hypothetical protein
MKIFNMKCLNKNNNIKIDKRVCRAKKSTSSFFGVPGMGTIYRVKVPNTEGDVGVSQEQGCRG